MGALLGKIGPDESKMVHLGHAAWKMAKQVFHASTPMWTTKECNAFMAKYLQLVPRQKKEYKADLQKEDFFKEYEKQPGFQAAFEYMRKMQASARSHRTGMIPLFHLADALMKTTEETRDTLDRCGAVVVPDNEPEAQYTGWGQESVPALLKPLQSGLKVDLKMWTAEQLKLDDLDLSDEAQAIIRARCEEIIDRNTKHAQESLALVGGAFGRVYNLHRENVNATSDGLWVFLRCYTVNDSNIRKLVRTKVLSIFKPSL